MLRLDALATAERDRAAAEVAKHGRESLATQVRRACESVQDGLVERDTEVRRSTHHATVSRPVTFLPFLSQPGPAATARGALRRAPAALWKARHREKPVGPEAEVCGVALARDRDADTRSTPAASSSLVAGRFFERQLTSFSVPEELFGPLALRELENDRSVRKTEWCGAT